MSEHRGRPAYVLLGAAAAASTWTGLRFGGLQPVDWLLVLTVVASASLLIKKPLGVPTWVYWGAAGIGAVLVLQLLRPTDVLYSTSRFVLRDTALLTAKSATSTSSVVAAGQWLIALLVVPIIVANIVAKSGRSVEPILWAWATGAAASALVAFSDFLGATNIGSQLVGYVVVSGRQSGLASHPNNLGFSCAIAAPVALYLLSQRAIPGLLLLLTLASGTLLSGSRGAQVGFALAVLATVLLLRGGRQMLPALVYFGAIAGAVILATGAAVFSGFSQLVRFGDQGAGASDQARQLVATQAILDFQHNPIYGTGFDVLTAAHSVYLQLISSGGVLLAVAILWFWLGAIRSGRALSRSGVVLGGYLACSVATWLAIGTFENQITDRYLYFPVAGIVALVAAQRRRGEKMASVPRPTPAGNATMAP